MNMLGTSRAQNYKYETIRRSNVIQGYIKNDNNYLKNLYKNEFIQFNLSFNTDS